MSRAFGLLVRWLSFHLHHLSSHRMWSLLSDGWFSSTESGFSQWNANHPLAGALPGLGGFKVTFSFAEDEETFNVIVCWFSPSFISWSYKMTLMTQLGLQHTTYLHTVAIIYTTGLVIFLITMAALYNSQSFFSVYNLGLLLLDSTVYCSVWNWIRQRKTWAEGKLGRKQPKTMAPSHGCENWGLK